MISNQNIQESIDDVRAITRIDLCVMDTNGITVASTFELEELPEHTVENFAASPAERGPAPQKAWALWRVSPEQPPPGYL